MKGIVVGGGSIGKRHLQNLRTLGIAELALVETDAQRRSAVAEELNTAAFAGLEEGLAWSPDFVVLSTPTHLHGPQAVEVVRAGYDLFVEKPLSHLPDGLAELANSVARKKLISLVGCNMRFHPGPQKVKELLDRNTLGKILFARLHAGSYLPEWRPGTDYRRGYAALAETGGGCILDGIHEIDLARWYLGEVEEVLCLSGHLSSLQIATEDVAALIFRHENGVVTEVHLDYVQRTYERSCHIAGEAGSIFWDFNTRQVRWFDAVEKQWTIFEQPPAWQLNQMYVDEMRHFLDCLQTRNPTVLPIPEAVTLMDVVFAAKESSRQGRTVGAMRPVRM